MLIRPNRSGRRMFRMSGNRTGAADGCPLPGNGGNMKKMDSDIRKDTFNRFLAVRIQLPVFRCVPKVLDQFHVIFPDMSSDNFLIRFAVCASFSGWTIRTNIRFAFVLAVSVAVCG